MRDSAFLRDFRNLAAQHTRGCIIMERPDLVKELVLKHGAHDTTTRQTVLAELDAMKPRFSQWLPGHEIPEKHWVYRLGKENVVLTTLELTRNTRARHAGPRPTTRC